MKPLDSVIRSAELYTERHLFLETYYVLVTMIMQTIEVYDADLRDCSEFLVRGGGTFAGVGGYPFLPRFPRGVMNVLQRCRGGVSIFYMHKKKETELSKISLSRNSPCP